MSSWYQDYLEKLRDSHLAQIERETRMAACPLKPRVFSYLGGWAICFPPSNQRVKTGVIEWYMDWKEAIEAALTLRRRILPEWLLTPEENSNMQAINDLLDSWLEEEDE